MYKLMLTVLMLGVCFGFALGDVKCFLTHLTNCSQVAGGQTMSGPAVGVDMCKNRKEFFDCAREKNKECSTDYNLDGVERMYERICTNGTIMNKLFVKYQNCILQSIQAHTSCSQDIIDFVKKFKVITPDVIFEISKLACKERDSITTCLYDFIAKDCGVTAKLFMEVVSHPSDKVNKKICRDALKPDQD